MKNILIVDDDLGFIFWLGAVLIAADYQPWPACTVSDAITEVTRKPVAQIDLLIVNPSLAGVSELIALLRSTQAGLKVMALGPQDQTALPSVDAWRPKSGRSDDSAKREWARAIKHISGRQTRAA